MSGVTNIYRPIFVVVNAKFYGKKKYNILREGPKRKIFYCTMLCYEDEAYNILLSHECYSRGELICHKVQKFMYNFKL